MLYILVEDAAATAGKVKEAAASVIAEPFDVMGAGTMGVVSDPSGAVIGLWQPGTHHGFELKAVPGSFCWAELNSRDLPAGKQFYRSVFGWSAEKVPGMDYTQFKLGEQLIGGAMAAGAETPANAPSNWLVYFAVDDTDATVAKLTELGGGVFHAPEDIPGVGRFARRPRPAGCRLRAAAEHSDRRLLTPAPKGAGAESGYPLFHGHRDRPSGARAGPASTRTTTRRWRHAGGASGMSEGTTAPNSTTPSAPSTT